jgi:hypothetical protein
MSYMDYERVVKKIFESKMEGRRIGRPRLKDAEKDLWEIKVKRQ